MSEDSDNAPDPGAPPSPPTPAELRELAGRADQLAAAIRDAQRRLRAAADEPTRLAGFRLDDAAGSTAAAGAALAATAGDLARVRARSDCGADWGVCPEHGSTLRSSGGSSWCTAAGCGRSWNYDRGGLPCAEPAVSPVTDASGGTTRLCAGHTFDARNRLIGATIGPLPAGTEP